MTTRTPPSLLVAYAVGAVVLLASFQASGHAPQATGPQPAKPVAGSVQQPPPASPPATPPGSPAQRGGGQPRQFTPGPAGEWEWWNDVEVRKALGLTDAKVRRIENIFQQRVRQFAPFVPELQKERDILEQMTRERVVDEATYALQVSRVEMLRSEAYKTRTIMLYKIYLELTPDQVQKLNDIRAKRWIGRGGRGPASR